MTPLGTVADGMIRDMICCCCGSYAGSFHQWWNRDHTHIGYETTYATNVKGPKP